MLPYGRQSIGDEEIDAVAAVLRGDWLTTGPAVRAFEAELSTVAGGAHCVSVTSGTAALHTAYAAAGIGPGDEVVTSPLTFVATASTAALLGATVVFADVEPDTALLDPAAAKAALTDRTRVVAAVDYAGHPADHDALRSVADSAGALLLDDAAHSIGAAYRGAPIGAIADLTTFSFFPTKNLTTAEGGAVATRDAELARRAARFRNIGLVREADEFRITDQGGWHQEVHEFGLNYRLPDVLCAIGSVQLRRLPEFLSRRAELADRYRRLLSDVDGLVLPAQRDDVTPAWHLFPVRVLGGRRREIYDGMRAGGIGVQVNYVPVYWHPVFADAGYRRGLCPNAEAYYAQQLSLPMYPGLTDADQDRVVDRLRALLT
ncbi:DegT/DnrJ/EryC1/StrS family aminotransferase [Actinocatenispora comari]|uniref:UDP-4-amino-4,6-dideoxy-N-acetyl-beta-L-altrosami ne transaminase n=1 Tax=Actinocatenispora comari TaxID=2807577 RepID=A0A8J4A6R9_9ACTN|nr:aminotransferase class I/II-fold pyridoxal phosphate-dependent enzyme [Actinocatenispora comari]GIL25185.1 UDP-4-amino-4,6-dideoxy-N-acetyl-beta-L-altrosami ne transaminase [Actinocatenispora comari]